MADLTRHEQFLNHIAHPDEPAPTPQTREEFLLKEIADNKGGGSALPDITAEDNGSFPVAQNGEWGKIGGYSFADTTQTIITEQSVPTVKNGQVYIGQPSGSFDGVEVGASCTVIFNENEYSAVMEEDSGNKYIGDMSGGAPSFERYPFIIATMNGQMMAYFTSANPTIQVDTTIKTVTPSDDFRLAVLACLPDDG